jgi:hypothetical protein
MIWLWRDTHNAEITAPGMARAWLANATAGVGTT